MTADSPKLTRRKVLSGAALAGAGVLLGPATSSAAGQLAQSGRVFNRWVGTLDGYSPPLQSPRRFVLAGLQWSAPEHPQIELRSRRHDGPWSRWVPAAVTGHDADAQAAASVFGEPLWCREADLVQLRSSGPVRGLRVHFVAAAGPARAEPFANTAALPLAQPILDAGPGQPPIIARSAWAGGGAPPVQPPEYGVVEMAFVHHTDNPNGYSTGEVAPMLLAIYDFHRYVRGWFDIGYNFVIDAFGRIWEARAGGIDQAVSGAQAGGYNLVSTGVAVLGSFSAVVPSAAALAALERLLAWKLSLHGVPTLGTIRVRVDPAGASYTPFPPGAHVLLPRVAGHRDGDATSCPGDAFYYRLPQLRPRIAALAGRPAVLTLTGPPTVAAGASALLRGRLTLRGGTPLANQPLVIQRVGEAPILAQPTTDAGGNWSATVNLQQGGPLCAIHPTAPAAVSRVLELGVVPLITASLTGSPPTLSGTVSPARPSVTVDVYQLTGAHRRLVSSRRVRTQGGAFTVRPSFGRRHGSFQVVVRTIAGAGLLAGASAPLAVTR